MNKSILSRGLTLIELLVVIGILAVLLTITLVFIKPARQLSQANNVKRSHDVKAILNAIHQYAIDNRGALPAGIPDTTAGPGIIGSTTVNICAALVTKYLAALPVDPLISSGIPVTDCTTAYNTSYTVVKSTVDNRITVAAPATELGVGVISVTH